MALFRSCASWRAREKTPPPPPPPPPPPVTEQAVRYILTAKLVIKFEQDFRGLDLHALLIRSKGERAAGPEITE